jgi:hypothetical protein
MGNDRSCGEAVCHLAKKPLQFKIAARAGLPVHVFDLIANEQFPRERQILEI